MLEERARQLRDDRRRAVQDVHVRPALVRRLPRRDPGRHQREPLHRRSLVVDIDLDTGALDIPQNIRRVGFWKDGAAPGSAAGAILLSGHVDSAKDGGGAFYPLKRARRGDVVKVTSDDGRTRSHRVTAVRKVLKSQLPDSIFSRTGPKRLVLVTCGGPFPPDVGHYRDNVILTAVPV